MTQYISDIVASFIALIIVLIFVALVMSLPALVITVAIEWLLETPIDRIGTWVLCDSILTVTSMTVSFMTKK